MESPKQVIEYYRHLGINLTRGKDITFYDWLGTIVVEDPDIFYRMSKESGIAELVKQPSGDVSFKLVDETSVPWLLGYDFVKLRKAHADRFLQSHGREYTVRDS